MRSLLLICLLTCLAGGLSACGYRVVGSLHPLPSGLERIEVALFENRSREPGLEKMLADALLEEFARRGVIEPVSQGIGRGDLALRGVVRDVRLTTSAVSSVGLNLEIELMLTVDVELLRGAPRERVWQHEGLRIREKFLASADAQVHVTNKEQALRSVAARLAGQLHDEIVQTF